MGSRCHENVRPILLLIISVVSLCVHINVEYFKLQCSYRHERWVTAALRSPFLYMKRRGYLACYAIAMFE